MGKPAGWGRGGATSTGVARGAAGRGREEGRLGVPGPRPRGPRAAEEAGKGGPGGEAAARAPRRREWAGPGARSGPAAATRAYLCQKGRARDTERRGSRMPAAPRCRRRPTAGGRSSATGSGEWAGGGGSGRGAARLQWLLRVTGWAGPARPEAARVRKHGRGGGGRRDDGC